MAKLMRNMLLLVKIQPTPFTDSVPTAALNSILARGISPQPIKAEFADRNLIRPYFGNMGKVQTQSYASIDFEVELAGAGVAGTAPKYGPLLRACGFSETITAATKVDYAPITSAQDAVTIHCYLDGIKYAMTDCKGSVAFDFNAKNIPVMKFKFVGFKAAVTDTANPTGSDFTGFLAPLAVNKQNTPTFLLHAIPIKATVCGVDMNCQTDYRNYIGSEAITFTDRKPTGKATFELDTQATKDWWSTINAGALSTMQMIHGTTAGNIVQLDAPKVQITNPSISDDNGLAFFGVDLELQPNIGNDELIVSVR